MKRAWWGFALAPLALVLKLIVLVQLRDHPLTQPVAGLDTTAYAGLAKQVLAGNVGLGPGVYYVSPLYIYFVAAGLAIFESFTAVRVVQIVLGTADLRVAIGAFGKQLFSLTPDASVMLMEFGQAAIPMVKFTIDPLEFDKGVNRIVSRPGVGSVLGEALEAANRELIGRPSTRRAIVSLNLEPSDEQSFDNANSIKESFRKSGAQIWAVSVQRGGLKASKRDVVLNDFAKLSGGKRDFVVGISAVENILKSYANALAMQYEVVYKRPETARNVKVIQVGTVLQNVKVHASGFAPQ